MRTVLTGCGESRLTVRAWLANSALVLTAALAVGAVCPAEAASASLFPEIDACDAQAASPYDVQRARDVPGVLFDAIDPSPAASACAAAIAVAPDVSRLQFQYCRALQRGRRFADAIAWCTQAARSGHTAAQYYMGLAYQSGEGVPRNDRFAHDWFQRAATAGNRHAMFEIAVIHSRGQGVKRDLQKARRMWKELIRVQEKDGASGDPELLKLSRQNLAVVEENIAIQAAIAAQQAAQREADWQAARDRDRAIMMMYWY